ncbi:GNAT family N-acetyltransferase [Salipiger sp. IMCC34102]|nr:GNAT family N-acetyltransferase [Salipiger sp. IMCC34102]
MASKVGIEPKVTTVTYQLSSFEFRDYRLTDREWVATVSVDHYTRIEGFDPSFAKAVSTALDLLEARNDEEASRFLIVETVETRRPVGCVFLSADEPTTGRLRLFYLDAAYRGLGIGRRMIEEVIAHAEAQGFERIRVSTYDRHEAACRLYRNLGFREQARKPALAFGQQMHQIEFEKTLPDYSR